MLGIIASEDHNLEFDDKFLIKFQTTFGRIFWSLVIILMLALGIYWCYEVYQGWTDMPVLTTITTAELPIQEVKNKNGAKKKFPSYP